MTAFSHHPRLWFEPPGFLYDPPRSGDFVLFSLHASVCCGHFVGWLYFAGFGIGVDV